MLISNFGNSVFRTGKNYYPQVFLEDCKYAAKEKMMSDYTTNETEISSNEENSNEENFDKENFDEEN